MKIENVKIAVALGTGLLAGGIIGYTIAERNARKKTEDEIAAMRRVFRKLSKTDSKETTDFDPEDGVGDEEYPETSKEDLLESVRIINSNGYRQSDPRPPVEIVVKEEIVYDPTRDVTRWQRDPQYPYVINEQEFEDPDYNHFSKISIKYYVYDQALVDDQDAFIPNDGLVDLDNLEYFGYGTESPDLVYIRNERIDSDFEVERRYENYSIDVLGVDPDSDIGQMALAKQREYERNNGR